MRILFLSVFTFYGASHPRPVVFTIDKVRASSFMWTPAPKPAPIIGRVVFKVGIKEEEITKLRDDRPRSVFIIRSKGILMSKVGLDGRGNHSLEYK